MNIKVLGGGCKSCEALLASAKEAVAQKGIDAEIEYITDMEKIMGFGVMSMPALIIDGCGDRVYHGYGKDHGFRSDEYAGSYDRRKSCFSRKGS